MRRRPTWALAAVLSLGLAACGSCKGSGGGDTGGRLAVVASIFPVYDLVRTVAGPDADVMLMLQPGRNEHHFDPTPKEVEQVARARLGVMVGLGLDPWMEKLMKDAAPKARVLKVGDKVPTLKIQLEAVGDDDDDDDHDKDHHHDKGKAKGKGDDKKAKDHDHDHDHDHEKGAVDPHVWLDPQRAKTMVLAIADELAAADAPHTAGYRERAAALAKSLTALDDDVAARMKALPKKQLITFHGSFGYFADRYGLQIVAVIEPAPGSTPTGDYITKVLKVVNDKKVPALFSEPQLDPRPAKVIADQAKLPLGVLDPVGGGPQTDGYEKMIRYDAAELEKYMK
jgi:zinc transport system substrate-binding protein